MIAIQGHSTKGNEVIRILESLGGINRMNQSGCYTNYFYYISGDDNTIAWTCIRPQHLGVFTLEEFKEKFPLKIGETVITTLNHVGTIIGIVNGKYKVLFKEDSALIAPRRLKPYKEMERNVILTLNKAKEWYKKGGELKEVALQAFTEEELNPLPRSWEEFCKQGHPVASWRDNIPIKYEVLFQLEQLRNCWLNGWKPKWDTSEKWCIRLYKNQLHVGLCTDISRFLTFPTREMAEEFLKCFKDLIEVAKDLI